MPKRKAHLMGTIRRHENASGGCVAALGSALLGALVVLGCGDGESEPITLERAGLRQEDSDVPVSDATIFPGDELAASDKTILPEPELVCARDEAREATEDERPFGEAYYPLAVDAEIAAFPELERALGFSHLENCEQARSWTALRGAIVDGRPDTPVDLTPSDPDPIDVDVTEKILAGNWHTDNSILAVVKLGIDEVGVCSSVVIAPRLLLTSAHCVEANTTVCFGPAGNYACNKSEVFEIRRATAYNPVTGLVYSSYGTVNVTTFKHENYGGSGDRSDDIALLYLETLTLPSSYARPLDLNFPLGWFYASGWGRTSNSGTSDAGIGLRKPNGDAKFDVDWWPTDFSYIEDTGDGDVNICRGDSGSPAVSFVGVAGIASGHAPASTKCRLPGNGYAEWWTSIRSKYTWIEPRIRALGLCPQSSGTCCFRNSTNTQATCF